MRVIIVGPPSHFPIGLKEFRAAYPDAEIILYHPQYEDLSKWVYGDLLLSLISDYGIVVVPSAYTNKDQCDHLIHVGVDWPWSEGSVNLRKYIKSDTRAPQVDVRAPQLDVRAPQVDVRAPQVDVRAPQVDVRAPQVDVRAPQVDVRAPQVDVRAPQLDIWKLQPDQPVEVWNPGNSISDFLSRKDPIVWDPIKEIQSAERLVPRNPWIVSVEPTSIERRTIKLICDVALQRRYTVPELNIEYYYQAYSWLCTFCQINKLMRLISTFDILMREDAPWSKIQYELTNKEDRAKLPLVKWIPKDRTYTTNGVRWLRDLKIGRVNQKIPLGISPKDERDILLTVASVTAIVLGIDNYYMIDKIHDSTSALNWLGKFCHENNIGENYDLLHRMIMAYASWKNIKKALRK